jgi:CRISPR-associated endoribonuclease Cas6
MPRRKATSVPWSADTELVGLVFELEPLHDCTLYPQYAIALHAWFLDQVRQFDPQLSAALHDEESEKPFTLSRLEGITASTSGHPKLKAGQSYRWFVSALSKPVVQWMAKWLKSLPEVVELRNAPMRLLKWAIAHPPTTYARLFDAQSFDTPYLPAPTVALSFISPTGFRRKGHHLPLPMPTNVFHSYLRRWNNFSDILFDQEDYLNWVDETVVILRHQVQSMKVVAGKRGSVTGFVGAVEFGLAGAAATDAEYQQLFVALGQLAPYCGTGHKTPFGLGQTRLGWLIEGTTPEVPTLEAVLARRIDELTEQFIALRKRTGGDRASQIAETWATILARRELGESLVEIATDLEMPYETVKTYAKLARRATDG